LDTTTTHRPGWAGQVSTWVPRPDADAVQKPWPSGGVIIGYLPRIIGMLRMCIRHGPYGAGSTCSHGIPASQPSTASAGAIPMNIARPSAAAACMRSVPNRSDNQRSGRSSRVVNAAVEV
jgi:hypothetical protein